MCKNTKRFLKNSLFSALGFLLADAVMYLSYPIDSLKQYKTPTFIGLLAVVAVGLFFYGYKVLKPLKTVWQTILSVGVLTIPALFITSILLTFLFDTDYPAAALLLIPSNPIFELLPANLDISDIAATGILFLSPFLPFLYMCIGAATRALREEENCKMKENTKRFLRNSLIALLGFLAADVLTAIVLFSPVFSHINNLHIMQLAAGTVLLLNGAGLMFIGYTFVQPLKRSWQTVMSVTVVPIPILLATLGLLYVFFQSQYPLRLLTAPANLIFVLIPEETGLWQNDLAPLICLCLAPLLHFVCITVSTVVRRTHEFTERLIK